MDIHSTLTKLDFGVILLYLLAVMALGFWVSFKKGHTGDLFLAGRRLGWPNIGLSIWGTNISPSMMIATCGVAYSTGVVAGNFSWLAWPFLLLLGMVFIPHYLNTKICTMPEFMSRRFSEPCRVFLSWYTLASTLVIWLGGTLYAGGLLLGQILNWPLWFSIIFLTVIATSFTVAGGLMAVVITDSFQTVLMIVASAALTIIGLHHVGGIGELFRSTPPQFWNLVQTSGESEYPWYAVFAGYPVLAIWFWCTDQTIVQRALGARDLRQAQRGTLFAGFLKILDVPLFILPGIICCVLHPNLSNPDQAYTTMVATYLPPGMVGLIIAVLIAALISTVDSGLNSFSTVFTLDIYHKYIRADASTEQTIRIGRIVTVIAAAIAILMALGIASIENRNLFAMLQSLIGYFAPPMAAVFLVGVLWKRATAPAAFWTLVIGSIVSLSVGFLELCDFPSEQFWPHFLLLSFLLFVGLVVLFVSFSLLTAAPSKEKQLPTLKDTYGKMAHSTRPIWFWWVILAIIMLALYILPALLA